MADIICRWRNGTPETVVELVNSMPHEVLISERFRNIMSTKWDGDFFRTPYQLACQLGLYYESEEGYFFLVLTTISQQKKPKFIYFIGFLVTIFRTRISAKRDLTTLNVLLSF